MNWEKDINDLELQLNDWKEEWRLYQNPLLSRFTTFQLGGPCPWLFETSSFPVVQKLMRFCFLRGIHLNIIGGGSNLLISDRGIPNPILRYAANAPGSGNFIQQVNHQELYVSACTWFDALATYCVEHGWKEGVEASGIPGTVGGAVVGNAGAFGWDIGSNVTKVEICQPDGSIIELSKDQLVFRYRSSNLKNCPGVVLGVYLKFSSEDPELLRRRRLEILSLRQQKHPDIKEYPCAGSFFRNLEPSSAAERRRAAGYFLEQAGALNFREGGAGVFPKHANIIVKISPDCRSQDVYLLHLRMKEAVKRKFDIDLTPEVLFWGEF